MKRANRHHSRSTRAGFGRWTVRIIAGALICAAVLLVKSLPKLDEPTSRVGNRGEPAMRGPHADPEARSNLPSLTRERTGGFVPVVGRVHTDANLPLGSVKYRVVAGKGGKPSAVATSGLTSHSGQFKATFEGAVRDVRVEIHFADAVLTRIFYRDPSCATEPWSLPDIFIGAAVSLTLEIDIGPDTYDLLRQFGSTLQIRVRDGEYDTLFALDQIDSDIKRSFQQTIWISQSSSLWIGAGLRQEFSPVTSWFYKSEIHLQSPLKVVRIRIDDRMIITGRVIDQHGAPVPGAVVQFAVREPEVRLLRAQTHPSGRFALILSGNYSGTMHAKIGSTRGPSIDATAGDRPELRIDLSRCLNICLTQRGEPIREPFFIGFAHPSRRLDPGRSGLSDYRKPRVNGVATISNERLEAGARLFFESESAGERMIELPFAISTSAVGPTVVEIDQSLGHSTIELRLPGGVVSPSQAAKLSLSELMDIGSTVAERQHVRYRIDVASNITSIPSILRLPYRVELHLPNGAVVTSKMELATDSTLTLVLDAEAAARLTIVPSGK